MTERKETPVMEIKEIRSRKKEFLPLLLMGDEEERMIDRYLERGTLYAAEIGKETAAVCVVTEEEGVGRALRIGIGIPASASVRGTSRRRSLFTGAADSGRSAGFRSSSQKITAGLSMKKGGSCGT